MPGKKLYMKKYVKKQSKSTARPAKKITGSMSSGSRSVLLYEDGTIETRTRRKKR